MRQTETQPRATQEPITLGVHGVHLDCQRDAAFLTARCGIALDQGPEGSHERITAICEACDLAERCPVCGAPMLPMTLFL